MSFDFVDRPQWLLRLRDRLGRRSTTRAAYASGPDFERRLAWLQQTDAWSTPHLNAYARGLRGHALQRATQSIPFYRDRFAKAQSSPLWPLLLGGDPRGDALFESLPTMNKSDLRRQDRALAREPKFGEHRSWLTTGGTTGEPVGFWHDSEVRWWEEAFVWRHWQWHGLQVGDSGAICRGTRAPGGAPIGTDSRGDLVLSGFDLSWASASDYLSALEKHSPAYLRGYPSSLDLLARRLRAEPGRWRFSQLRVILTSSELLAQSQRQLISTEFGAPVVDLYGHAERAVAAGECEHQRLHVFQEYGWLELLDGERVIPRESTEPGEIVATGFRNQIAPLIRYRTGDVARWDPEPCPCLRSSPVLRIEQGRRQDRIVTPDGHQVTFTALNFHDRAFDGIEIYQMVQHTIDELTFRFVPLETGPDLDRVENALRQKLGSKIAIEFQSVKAIPRTTRGKHRVIISTVEVEDG